MAKLYLNRTKSKKTSAKNYIESDYPPLARSTNHGAAFVEAAIISLHTHTLLETHEFVYESAEGEKTHDKLFFSRELFLEI